MLHLILTQLGEEGITPFYERGTDVREVTTQLMCGGDGVELWILCSKAHNLPLTPTPLPNTAVPAHLEFVKNADLLGPSSHPLGRGIFFSFFQVEKYIRVQEKNLPINSPLTSTTTNILTYSFSFFSCLIMVSKITN